MKNYLVLCLLAFGSTALQAQGARNGAPKIFLDCDWGCDQQYLKSELSYLNFMRDRADADIFIQQNAQQNGGGGTRFNLFFFGQKQFAGQNDTLSFHVPPATSDNDGRQLLKATIERGLLPYLLQTPLADKITFSVNADSTTGNTVEPATDPWNFWTFSVRSNISVNGQEIAKSLNLFGRVEANRVTERQKTHFRFGGEYGRNTFQFEDTLSEVYENGGFFFNLSEILAINDHWSYGFFGNGRQAQYNNLKINTSFRVGVEYNLYPYQEVARRQLTFRYRLGPQFNRYFDETVYFKQEELLWEHSLAANYRQVFQWGTFNLGAYQANYMHNWKLNETLFYGGLELNLFKGFRLYLDGEYRVTHNQVELPSGGASKEEALLRIRQLQSGYNYGMYVGISYTFGSIYSNVVNPRF